MSAVAQDQPPSVPEQCIYMAAAYPDLDGDETCRGFHQHDSPVFALAKVLAAVFQEVDHPSEEQTAWFLNDAAAVVGDFSPAPEEWQVSRSPFNAKLRGIAMEMEINGVAYVLPESESEPALPERLADWLAEAGL